MKKLMWLLPIIALVISCGGEEESYFPLSAGNEWEYALTMTYIYIDTTTETGTTTIEIEAMTTLDNGTDVFPMIMTMDFEDTLIPTTVDTMYIEEAEDCFIEYDSQADTVPDDTVLVLPLEAGNTWGDYEVTDQVDITVPAGDFSDCWEIRQVMEDDTAYWYWKSGVGPVQMSNTEIELNETYITLMELETYNVD